MGLVNSINIGIDPGSASGACVVIIVYNSGEREINTLRFDKSTEADIVNFLAMYVGPQTRCILEKVNPMPGEGSVSIFKFGANYGLLRGALMGLKIPFNEVTPQLWQVSYVAKSTGRRSISASQRRELSDVEYRTLVKSNKVHNGKIRAHRKKLLKQKSQQLFPHEKVINVVADALLLADYCMRYF